MGNLIARHFGELSATKIRYKLKGASLVQRENKALLFVASSFEFTLGGIVAFESCILSVTMGLLREHPLAQRLDGYCAAQSENNALPRMERA
jgi:hypothetical protein